MAVKREREKDIGDIKDTGPQTNTHTDIQTDIELD